MITGQTTRTEEQIDGFIKRLEELDPGERARLKRNAGRSLADSHDVLGLFFRLLPQGVPPRQREWYYLVATLYPLASPGTIENLGGSLRHARSEANGRGLDRRVEALLDADRPQIPFRLRRTISFLQSNRVGVNWPRLLKDLIGWEYPNRSVQQQWAQSYFAG